MSTPAPAPAPTSEPAPGPPFFRRRGLYLGTAVVALLATGALVGLPYAIAYGAKHWLRAQGAREVRIEDVDFNPFQGLLAVRGLEVEDGSGQLALRLPALSLDIEWRPLLRREVHVTGLDVQGLALTVEQSAEGALRLGGIALPAAAPAAEPSAPWHIGVERLQVADSEVRYRRPDIETLARVDDLRLAGLSSTTPDEPARLELRGGLDGRSLEVAGTLDPFGPTRAFDGTVKLAQLSLDKLAGMVPDLKQIKGAVTLDGTLRVTGGEAQWEVAHDGSLALERFELATPGLEARQARLQWQGQIQSVAPTGPGKLDVRAEGRLQGAPGGVSLSAGASAIRYGALDWAGRVEIDRGPEGLRTRVTGESSLTELQAELKQPAARRVQLASLGLPEIDLEVMASEKGPTRVRHKGKLTAGRLTAHDPRARVEQRGLTWSGETRATLGSGDTGTHLALQGSLDSKGLAVDIPARSLALGYEELAWKGDAKATLSVSASDWGTTGELSLRDAEVDASARGIKLATFDRLTVKGLEGGPDRLAIANVELAQLRLARGEEAVPEAAPAILAAARVVATQVDFSPTEGLAIGTFEATDTTQILRRYRDGQWNVLRLVDVLASLASGEAAAVVAGEPAPASARAAAEPGATPADGAPWGGQPAGGALPLRIGRFSMTGGSVVEFDDQGVERPFKVSFRIRELSAEGYDSRQPDQALPVVLSGSLGDSADLTLKGWVKPFAPRLTMAITGKVAEFSLTPLSSYTAPLIGYNLDAGQLDADLDLKIELGKISATNELTLRALAVSPLDSEETRKFDAQLSVPIETALGMLRDKNNVIRLKIPVTGDIDDPTFDASDAINQALASAMKTGAMTIVATALFPYGTLLTVASMAGEAASRLRLDPLAFAPGSAELTPESHDYLRKLGKLLAERPEINIRVCGVAVAADEKALLAAAATPPAQARDGEPAAPVPGENPPVDNSRRVGAPTEAKDSEPTASAQDANPPVEKARRAKPERKKGQPAKVEARTSVPAGGPGADQQPLEALAHERASVVKQFLVERLKIATKRLVICRPMLETKEADAKPRVDLLI